MAENESPGRGWHGDSAGHARAGKVGGERSPGNFKRDRAKASLAGKRSGGNFANNPEKAAAAGRAGGSRTQAVRQAAP